MRSETATHIPKDFLTPGSKMADFTVYFYLFILFFFNFHKMRPIAKE